MKMVCPKKQNFCHVSFSPIVMRVESLDLNLGVGWLHPNAQSLQKVNVIGEDQP